MSSPIVYVINEKAEILCVTQMRTFLVFFHKYGEIYQLRRVAGTSSNDIGIGLGSLLSEAKL